MFIPKEGEVKPRLAALRVGSSEREWVEEIANSIEMGTSFEFFPQLVEYVLSTCRKDGYKDISLTKPGHEKRRPISVPNDRLRMLQSQILKRIPFELVHPCSYAYQPGKSAIKCAEAHVGMKWGIKVDITDYFHQIRASNVEELFLKLGATELSAKLYAIVLTRLPKQISAFSNLKGNGFLPQGSPTSGAISNLICAGLDESIFQIATKHGMNYTRYSDDILISSPKNDFTRVKALRILKKIRVCVNSYALNLNKQKTRIYSQNGSHQYLGLLIGQDRVKLPEHYRRKIINSARALEKFGLGAVEEEYTAGKESLSAHKSKSAVPASCFLTRFVGQLSYISQVEPEWSRELAHGVIKAILNDAITWARRYDEQTRATVHATLQKLISE